MPEISFEQIQYLSEHERERAPELCLTAIYLARDEKDFASLAKLGLYFGRVLDVRGNRDSDLGLMLECLQAAQNQGLGLEEAHILRWLGRAHYTRADYLKAMQLWAQCLDAAEAAGCDLSWTEAKLGICQIYDALDLHHSAIKIGQKAMQRALQIKDDWLSCRVALSLGVNYFRLGSYAEAEQSYRLSYDFAQRISHPEDIGAAHYRLAELLIAQNQLPQAEEELDKAATACEQAKDYWGLANVYGFNARIAHLKRELISAQQLLEIAIGYAYDCQSHHMLKRLYGMLAEVCQQNQDAPAALQALQQQQAHGAEIKTFDVSIIAEVLDDLSELQASPERLLVRLHNQLLPGLNIEQAILQQAIAHGLQIIKSDHCSFWHFHEQDKAFICLASSDPEQMHLVINDPEILLMFDKGLSIPAHLAQHHRACKSWLTQVFAEPPQSIFLQGIKAFNRIKGLLLFSQQHQARHWHIQDSHLANQLAMIVNTAMENLARQQDMKQIAELNNELEERVATRTAELEKAMHELMHQTQMQNLNTMLAGLAHEMNTPLGNALLANSSSLAEVQQLITAFHEQRLSKQSLATFLEQDLKSHELMERNIAKASSLIQQLKDLLSNSREPSIELFTLSEMLHSCQELFQAQLSQSEHSNLKFELQSPSQELRLISYRAIIEQCLQQLLENSLRHAFSANQQGKILLTALIEGPDLVLQVSDNGQGMSQSTQEQCFNPFFTTQFGKGSNGLGLYWVHQQCTSLLKGSISCQSSEQGSRFCIRLPLQEHQQ